MAPENGQSWADQFEHFFAGVDEMRAVLNRGVQDAENRGVRLAGLARDLPRLRGSQALGRWLVDEIRDALGAKSCALWVYDHDWLLLHRVGESSPALNDRVRAALSVVPAGKFVDGRTAWWLPEDVAHGDWLCFAGSVAPIGLLWLELGEHLDGRNAHLLEAITGTAGMMMEQALAAEQGTVRHPRARSRGLDFMEQAEAELRRLPPPGFASLVFALQPTQNPLAFVDETSKRHALRAAKAAMAPGSLVDVVDHAMLAITSHVALEEAGTLAAAWFNRMRDRIVHPPPNRGQKPPIRGVYVVVARPVHDVRAMFAKTLKRLQCLEPGQWTKIS